MIQDKKKLGIVLIVLILSGIAPNLFPISQTGTAPLSSLATKFLIPSVVLIFIIIGLAHLLKYTNLKKQIINCILAGMVATIGLEIIREIGFRLGGMPGDMPKLMGVLLLDRFADGPDFWSNLAGWSYHFWNGAAFGIIFSLLFGRGKLMTGIFYGFLIGIGFMISPVTRTLGIGTFGLQFKDGYQFMITVTLAHIAFGGILGFIIHKINIGQPNIFKRIKDAFININ
ncbi:MAG: hypothetical protein Q8891_06320 [Bacteroidota bacterium]|nr:hypothetical protein [Bacteroidota bacterium]